MNYSVPLTTLHVWYTIIKITSYQNKLCNKRVSHLHYINDSSLSFQLHIFETLTYPPDLTLFLADNESNISSFTCISK